ncbi:MAG: hypothetical protein WB535_05955 [Paenarthrobacter sp.]
MRVSASDAITAPAANAIGNGREMVAGSGWPSRGTAASVSSFGLPCTTSAGLDDDVRPGWEMGATPGQGRPGT